jgi:hypothetical protein
MRVADQSPGLRVHLLPNPSIIDVGLWLARVADNRIVRAARIAEYDPRVFVSGHAD